MVVTQPKNRVAITEGTVMRSVTNKSGRRWKVGSFDHYRCCWTLHPLRIGSNLMESQSGGGVRSISIHIDDLHNERKWEVVNA